MDDDEVSASLARNFKQDLIELLPHLRAFARSMCGRADLADDLVQETALKAWSARDTFLSGTNMRAWTFTILRNQFLSLMRRDRHKVDFEEIDAERLLIAKASQEDNLQLADVEVCLRRMTPERREAVLLVGAGGFTYEEAAKICDCPIGTMKSRVSRARAQLASYFDTD